MESGKYTLKKVEDLPQMDPIKMPEVRLRRIKLNVLDEKGKVIVVTIAPSAVLPYMTGYTEDVEKALFLRRFGVPFWALKADSAELTEAYGHFQKEGQQFQPGYTPQTVNTDGWAATQKAWLTLFPLVVIIECFLHAFLKIRDRFRHKFQAVYPEIKQRVWDIYAAPVHRLNKRVYHDNWLHSLLISTSLAGANC